MTANRILPLGGLAWLVVAAWLTRAPLAPQYLFYFDSVNYALALEEFNPALHQPQPPGYPLYVAFARFVNLFTESVEETFLWTGIIATALACWLLWRVGEEMFGRSAGRAAALLLLFHPVLWFNGLTNQGRAFLAVASAGAAWAAWRAADREASRWWLWGGAMFLGVMGGFRPEAALLLAPLLAWAAWRRRAPWAEWGGMALFGLAPVAVWLPVLFAASGGRDAYFQLLEDYSRDQFAASSAFWGASWRSAWKMIESALVFNMLGVLAWGWAACSAGAWRGLPPLLLVWFLPAFLFQCVIHVADPDHALLTVPVLCLVGGHALANFSTRPLRVGIAILAAICVSAGLFFHPLRGAARPVSYQVVKRVDEAVRQAFAAVEQARRNPPVTVLVHGSLVTWRHITYYFPEAAVIVIEAERVWSPTRDEVYHLFPVPLDAGGEVVVLTREGAARHAATPGLTLGPAHAQFLFQ